MLLLLSLVMTSLQVVSAVDVAIALNDVDCCNGSTFPEATSALGNPC